LDPANVLGFVRKTVVSASGMREPSRLWVSHNLGRESIFIRTESGCVDLVETRPVAEFVYWTWFERRYHRRLSESDRRGFFPLVGDDGGG
jgi:hypothetical protein